MTQTRRHPRPQAKPQPRTSKKRQKKSAPRRRGPLVRVLPMMILVALFVLGFRVNIVVQDVQTMMASVDVSQPSAVAQEDVGGRIEEFEQEALGEGAGDMAEDGDMMADGAMDEEETAATNEASGLLDGPVDTAGAGLNLDQRQFTRSELDLLQRLSERRNEIEAQAKELDTQEAMLRAAEARIDGKIAELQELEATLTELVAEADAQQQAKIERLVRVYGAMKPKDAARIFNDLEMPILITVVEIMRENKVAPILAQMDPVKATAVTEALTTRQQIPGLQGEPQG